LRVVINYDLREVALNKPSFQVSTMTDQYGTHAASLANDGSRQTNHRTVLNSCAHSMSETNPWWAVDLEVPTLVARVDLTNRGDAYGTRVFDFTIFCTGRAVHNAYNGNLKMLSELLHDADMKVFRSTLHM